MNIKFSKKLAKDKTYKSKSIDISFHLQHFFKFQWKNNGAVKGVDKRYDLNINFLGVLFLYTNWNYSEI